MTYVVSNVAGMLEAFILMSLQESPEELPEIAESILNMILENVDAAVKRKSKSTGLPEFQIAVDLIGDASIAKTVRQTAIIWLNKRGYENMLFDYDGVDLDTASKLKVKPSASNNINQNDDNPDDNLTGVR